jgi:hypothetical protein
MKINLNSNFKVGEEGGMGEPGFPHLEGTKMNTWNKSITLSRVFINIEFFSDFIRIWPMINITRY